MLINDEFTFRLQIYFICLYLTIFVPDSISMKINILLFGITKDLVGKRSLNMDVPDRTSVGELRKLLTDHYPELEDVSAIAIAVNNEYAGDEFLLNENDEIALLPPVSGG